MQDCYEILNVTADATRGEIKRGYHQMSLKYHPDKVSDQNLNPCRHQPSNLKRKGIRFPDLCACRRGGGRRSLRALTQNLNL